MPQHQRHRQVAQLPRELPQQHLHLTLPCRWPSARSWSFTFEEVNIEAHSSCGYDYVQVVNGDGSQLVKTCSIANPQVIKSSGIKMTVVSGRQ